MTVRLDLRRDLPKLRKALPELLNNLGGQCLYAQPCAVGVMVNPRKRGWLDCAPYDDTQIDTLYNKGMVEAPRDQVDDLRALQVRFDQNDGAGLRFLVDVLSVKYGVASAIDARSDETAQQAQPEGQVSGAQSADVQPTAQPSSPSD